MNQPTLVLGGGISGLAAAERLHALGAAGLLVEAERRLGGLVRTEALEGCTLDVGPDSLVTHKAAGIVLCRRLGLADELVPLSSEGATSVVRGDRLHPLPRGLHLVAPTRFGPLIASPLFSIAGRMRAAAEIAVPSRLGDADESVRDFVERRFGREMEIG